LIAGVIFFLIYIGIIAGVVLLARKSVAKKRDVILKRFNLQESQIRSTAYDDPMVRKMTSLQWAMTAVLGAVLLIPVLPLGDNILFQIVLIIVIEAVFLMLGLLAVRLLRLLDWYRECYITDMKFYRVGLAFTAVAIVLGNAAFAVPMFPYGLGLSFLATLLIAPALYISIKPILQEQKYYEDEAASGTQRPKGEAPKPSAQPVAASGPVASDT
jgi:hypothetical protein